MAKKPIKETTQKRCQAHTHTNLLWYRGESLLEILYEYPILGSPRKVGNAVIATPNNSECWYKGYEKKNLTHSHRLERMLSSS